jgi:hypothetical protein
MTYDAVAGIPIYKGTKLNIHVNQPIKKRYIASGVNFGQNIFVYFFRTPVAFHEFNNSLLCEVKFKVNICNSDILRTINASM